MTNEYVVSVDTELNHEIELVGIYTSDGDFIAYVREQDAQMLLSHLNR